MSDIQSDQIDIDNDGNISPMEIDLTKNRFRNRRKMAWLAMVSMVSLTSILLTDLISLERIKVVDNVFEMFYIAMASVVGAYMGFTTWASKK